MPDTTSAKSNAWVTYLLGWLTGLIMFFTAKDEYTKFHAAQSIILFGGLQVLSMIFFRGWGYGSMMMSPFYSLFHLAVFVLWVFLMVKAYGGEKYKLPVLGDLAEQWAKK